MRGNTLYAREFLTELCTPTSMAANPLPPASMQYSLLDRYLKDYSRLDGWFWPDSVAIWDSLLSFQKSCGVMGHFLEIGVYRGKSAVLSTLHAREDEACILVDPHIHRDLRPTIDPIKPSNVIYAQMRSTELLHSGAFTKHSGNFRWIHIDGEHTGMAVINDMNIANPLLNDDGVMIIDDFFNPQYPQITAAVFDWLRCHPIQLTPFLIGDNKGYLCRARSAHSYLSYVKDSLFDDMVARNRPNVSIWKTTPAADMNTFGITPRFENFNYVGPDWNRKTIEI